VKKLRIVMFAGLLAAGACAKSNENVPVLQEEASALVKYNKPKLDAFQKRLDQINDRVRDLPRTLPDMPEVDRATGEAKAKLDELRGKATSV